MRIIWEKDKTIESFIRRQVVRPEIRYKWSQFLFPVRLGSDLYLYNLFTKQCVEYDGDFCPEEIFVSDRVVEADPSLRELAFDYFLVPETRDERAYYEGVFKMVRAVSTREGFKSYVVLPTTGCNARCVYCYEKGMKQVAMTDEIVAKTIQFILSTHRKDADISLAWFGGEPLLGTRAIDAICSALAERDVKFHSTMTTNGSLLTEELVEKMEKDWRLTYVQVSMDGDEADYVAKKKYLLDRDHYRAALRGIDALARRNIRTMVRCNADANNLERMELFFRDLSEATSNKKQVSVFLRPLYAIQRGDRSGEIWKKCLDLQDRIVREGFAFAYNTTFRSFKSNHCMADLPFEMVMIAPDGTLYNCEHCPPGSKIGNLDEGVCDNESLRSFVNPETAREKCRDCAFLPECTPFSRCPVASNDCREVRKAQFSLDLKRAIEDKNRADEANQEEFQNC